ncbi:MAG TPA: hypothetical protein VK021_05200 [Flavobacteriaceae bacterium]|nr:hypothetical protein [Flavobacteriaceae bacterium]
MITSFAPTRAYIAKKEKIISKFSSLTQTEQEEFIEAFKNGDCKYQEINLWGMVKFVDAFPDITIQYVDSFADIRVKFVESFPNQCGKWEKVDEFPDFTVKVVEDFPDIKVQKVDDFPGINR